ncbi:PH domain-containing protein [Candidatus Saccharibacteria bacterium]|mgnify:FL=1|jgi:hypothetical protein|nr:PH domain-containing protein [Candidatus Saccharibacteria bacterium]
MVNDTLKIEGGGSTSKGYKKVVDVSRKHWVALDRAGLFGSLAVLILVLGLKFNLRPEIMLFLVSIFGLFCFGQLVSWWFSLTVLTNSGLEIINQKGLFRRSVVDIPFESIINTNYVTNGVLQALLGFGTIVIQTQSGDAVLEKMSRPAKRHDVIVANYDKFRGFEKDE